MVRLADATLICAAFTAAFAPPTSRGESAEEASYSRAVRAVAEMPRDPNAVLYTMKYGLRVLPLTWEDSGRFWNSAVGPNISDMTIQVRFRDPEAAAKPGRSEKKGGGAPPDAGAAAKDDEYRILSMPVVRFPNFSDVTADVPLERFKLLVGNEKGQPLREVTLREFLAKPRDFLSDPSSWKGGETSLLVAGDTHALVSAQACFLPVPQGGVAEFNPVLFNYQSEEGNPAVLTILATREGTSVTVIDNVRDAWREGFLWGQRLFFNRKGERASLTAKRLSEHSADGSGPAVAAGGEKGLNLVLLIQVPLKQKPRSRKDGFSGGGFGGFGGGGLGGGGSFGGPRQSDVEEAVISHGAVEGPFTEIGGLEIRRDHRFPIRVTVQFYQATSNGVVDEDDARRLAGQIRRVYEDSDFVGSLVVDGPTGRPTGHDGPKVEPPWWWDRFWKRHERNTGQTPEQAIRALAQAGVLGGWSAPDSTAELRRLLEKQAPKVSVADEPKQSKPASESPQPAASPQPSQGTSAGAGATGPSTVRAEEGAGDPEADEAVDRALDRRVHMSLKGETLEGLAGRLRGEFGVAVDIDHGSLGDERIDLSKVALTADLSGVALAEALDLLLEPHDIGWSTRGGAIVIGGVGAIGEMMELRVYDVTDLFASGDASGSVSELMPLLPLVPGAVWFDIDGTGGQMHAIKIRGRQLLVVSQTGLAHHRIRRLLQALRQAAADRPVPATAGE